MPYAQINGPRIYYEDTGGPGPAIVFSHGDVRRDREDDGTCTRLLRAWASPEPAFLWVFYGGPEALA